VDSNENALVPLDVRTVDFYGDHVTGAVVQVGDETQIYVPLRPICDYLGLAWSGQFERIKRDEVLAEAIRFVRVSRTNTLGGQQVALCLPLDYLPGWLFSISIQRVRPALRPALHRYRRDCYRILSEAFLSRPFLLDLLENDEAIVTVCPGTVYVIHGGKHYKIGLSRNVEKRLRALDASLPFPVTTVCTFETDNMLQLERQLHLIYRKAGKHVNGEWFDLSEADITALKMLPSPLIATCIADALVVVDRAARYQ
jgi:hypothetical protein